MLFISTFLVSFSMALAASSDDLITSLPGLAEMTKYKQYSGYLSASEHKHFHYWFVESQNDPTKDPVVLWLNGGPGCSSLAGFLTENGPLHVRPDGKTLFNNPYSWNRIANVLYLESPAGVGFSYDDNNNLTTDDDQVSMHNYNALVDFFKKFPEFGNNPFFVAGESYGGIYIPTLSLRIMQGSFKINFKGMAIGNSLSNEKLNDNSAVFFAYYHGLFGEVLWQELVKYCCNGTGTRHSCEFSDSQAPNCPDAVEEVFQYIYHSGLNSYALYEDCDPTSDVSLEIYRRDISHLFTKNRLVQKAKQYLNERYREILPNANPPCFNFSSVLTWVNNPEVRKALNIPAHLPTWGPCSDKINYTTLYEDMAPQYHHLLKNPDFRILLYNGDTDMVCNFLGDEWFVEGLKLPVVRSRGPWLVEGQVAGFAKHFKQLIYTTIRGSGHMVPMYRPSYAFAMFEKFIHDKPLQGA